MNIRAILFSLIMLVAGLLADHFFTIPAFRDELRLIWYLAAYIPVGLPVLGQAWSLLRKGEVFTEFFLMGIATTGAFAIGEFPEGVAVMLFYTIGEEFQHGAVHRARRNIRSLLDLRPEQARVERNGESVLLHPREVDPGEVLLVQPGERVPLDGVLLDGAAEFDTSALTGESLPRSYASGDAVYTGMINLTKVIRIRASGTFAESYISRILAMVEESSLRKAKTERFIRTFSRYYTPAVVGLALLLIFLPALFVTEWQFKEWLYRGLVFLVISCPCALVISIPLGYFGGVGAASQNGILVKGATFLDTLTSVRTAVFDKTGTLTRGRFAVEKADFPTDSRELFRLILAVEENSTHPTARAISDHLRSRIGREPSIGADHREAFHHGSIQEERWDMQTGNGSNDPYNGETLPAVEYQNEIPGMGVDAKVDGKRVCIGNREFMEHEKILLNGYGSAAERGTAVYVSVEGEVRGVFTLNDEIRSDAEGLMDELRKLGVGRTVMLSGDRPEEAQQVADLLGMDEVHAGLLPHEKAEKVEELKNRYPGTLIYAGDGINDAPVLAASDVGIAMGAMGSDVAIETADVVIQTDTPSRIATAIRIGRATRRIVWQNIGLALGVKTAVMAAGAVGIASLWGAVFADVGVALLAILNAIRIQKMDFS